METTEQPPPNGSPPQKPQLPAELCPLTSKEVESSSSRANTASSVKKSDEENLEDVRINLARLACDLSVDPRSLCEEDPSFKRLINALNPNSPFTFDYESLHDNCLSIYVQQRKKVKEVFSKFNGRVSLSMDFLTNERGMLIDEYLCLAAHFIDDDWKMRKWVIKYCRLNLKSPIEVALKSLKKWDIEGRLLALIIGGETDIIDYMKEDIDEIRKAPVNGDVFHLHNSSCDIISQMVEEGFNEIKDIISKVELLAWSKSLPLWYLTSAKLRDALELEALGEFSSQNVGLDYDVPSEEEWAKVRSMCKIADKIFEIVNKLFEVKRPTANLFLPHLQEIHTYLLQESVSDDDFVKAICQKMLMTFKKYWDDVYINLATATFMDPRYKMKFIEFCFSKHEGGEGDGGLTTSSVLETIRKLYDGYSAQNHQKEYSLTHSSSEGEEDEDWPEFEAEEKQEKGPDKHAKKQCCKVVDVLNVLSSYRWSMQSSNDDHPHKSDLDLYLEEPILTWTENFSVLLWWKDNSLKYPIFSRMARDFLAIPFSVAYSYEAYYTEKRVADRTVVSVKPNLMNAMMCTRTWKLHED